MKFRKIICSKSVCKLAKMNTVNGNESGGPGYFDNYKDIIVPFTRTASPKTKRKYTKRHLKAKKVVKSKSKRSTQKGNKKHALPKKKSSIKSKSRKKTRDKKQTKRKS